MLEPTLTAKQTGWRRYRLTCLRYLEHGQAGRPAATVGIGLVRYKADNSCPDQRFGWWCTTPLWPQDLSAYALGVGERAGALRLAIVAVIIDQQPPGGQKRSEERRVGKERRESYLME